jgi:hypothetical protein
MGAAAHNENDIVDECTTVIGNQVVAVGQLALSVATLGASMVATKASASSTNAGAFATLKKKYDEMVSLYETLKRNPATKLQAAEDAYPIGSKVWGVKTATSAGPPTTSLGSANLPFRRTKRVKRRSEGNHGA